MCVCVCVFAQVCAPIKRKATVACRCGTFFSIMAPTWAKKKENTKKSVILDVNPDGGGGGGGGG